MPTTWDQFADRMSHGLAHVLYSTPPHPHTNTQGLNVSTASSPVKEGLYSARLAATGGHSYMSTETSIAALHIWAIVRWATFPEQDVPVMFIGSWSGAPQFRKGIGLDAATRQLKPFANNVGAGTIAWGTPDGPALQPNVWYYIELSKVAFDSTNQRYNMQWAVDGQVFAGSAYTGTTQVASDFAAILGTGNFTPVPATTHEMYVDQWFVCLDGTANDTWPWGTNCRVREVVPLTDGTHNIPGAFTDDALNSPPVGVASRLDELPMTLADHVNQTTQDVNAYLEFRMQEPSLLPGEEIYAVSTVMARVGSCVQDLNRNWYLRCEEPDSPGTFFTPMTGNGLHSGAASYDGHFHTNRFPRRESGGSWTAGEIGAWRWRWGFAQTLSPSSRLHAVMLHLFTVGGDVAYWGVPLLDELD